jgi:hypothetical protein
MVKAHHEVRHECSKHIIKVAANLAISLREMSLARCTLHSQSLLQFSRQRRQHCAEDQPGVSFAMGGLQGHVSTERDGDFEDRHHERHETHERIALKLR